MLQLNVEPLPLASENIRFFSLVATGHVSRGDTSDRNCILMTQNLSEIRSEALIGRRSSYIVLAIVYE